MKKTLYTIAFTIILTGFSATAFAQHDVTTTSKQRTPKWVSKMGYWVAEGNINTPKHNTLYFYNNDNVLVYEETINGVVLKLNKRRTKMRLKKLVDQTVSAYLQKQTLAQNKMLVAKLIK